MVDPEKVLDGLEACADRTGALCENCPYDFEKDSCISDMARDAFELLEHNEETIASLQSTIDKLTKALSEKPEQKFFVDSDGKITPLPIQPQWISVEDKLPDKSNRYLVYFGKGIGTTMKTAYWLRTKQKWMGSEAHSTITDITHWMPLPEPPEVMQNGRIE